MNGFDMANNDRKRYVDIYYQNEKRNWFKAANDGRY